MNKEEILNNYIKLIDKGYCSDCNELNCIGNFPHRDIAKAICNLQQEIKILKENAEHNDKVVDKVNWENNLLKQENKKYKEVIDKVSIRLEYFLIGNLKYQSSQEEFIKLLNVLKEV